MTTPQDATDRVYCEACRTSVLPQNWPNHLLGATHERNAARHRITPPQDATEALARAVFEADRPGDWPTWEDYIGAFGTPAIPPWRRKADRLSAALAADGWSVVRTEELERLRRVEAAAREIDPFPPEGSPSDRATAWFVTNLPRLVELRAALGDPS